VRHDGQNVRAVGVDQVFFAEKNGFLKMSLSPVCPDVRGDLPVQG
jgi:hypothetical protein